MELVYLWVEEYKNIKRQGFNFSPKFRCEFKYQVSKNDDGEEVLKDCTILLCKKDCVENFFGDKINITAIVGENGSGKSSIIDILNNSYDNVFYIFYDNLTKKFLFHKIKINEYFTNEIKNILNKELSVTMDSEVKLSYPLSTVFYTNIVNNKTDEMYYGDEVSSHKKNISTGHLINKTNNYFNEMSQKSFPYISFFNQYKVAQSEDVKYSLDCLKNANFKLPFQAPLNLTLEITFKQLYESNFVKENAIKTRIELTKDSIDYIKNAIIANFLDYHLKSSFFTENPEVNKIAIEIYNKSNKSIKEFYDALCDTFQQPLTSNNLEILFIKQYFEEANQFLMICENIFVKKHGRLVYCPIDKIPNDFIELYQRLIIGGLPFLTFSFSPNISSGQENFLYMFARFYSLLKPTADNDKLQANIILCIDEGENTLHPQWQKEYVKYWIDFINKNFHDYHIHNIFTTHSPFILSDLPKENIIFLNKYTIMDKEVMDGIQREGDCRNISDKVDLQTFGANIHTLLSHGFFMQNGLMGEYAKNKINKIILFLNGKNKFIDFPINQITMIIEKIGEPFFKNKLLQMYYDKFPLSKDKEEKIFQLQKLIDELRK